MEPVTFFPPGGQSAFQNAVLRNQDILFLILDYLCTETKLCMALTCRTFFNILTSDMKFCDEAIFKSYVLSSSSIYDCLTPYTQSFVQFSKTVYFSIPNTKERLELALSLHTVSETAVSKKCIATEVTRLMFERLAFTDILRKQFFAIYRILTQLCTRIHGAYGHTMNTCPVKHHRGYMMRCDQCYQCAFNQNIIPSPTSIICKMENLIMTARQKRSKPFFSRSSLQDFQLGYVLLHSKLFENAFKYIPVNIPQEKSHAHCETVGTIEIKNYDENQKIYVNVLNEFLHFDHRAYSNVRVIPIPRDILGLFVHDDNLLD